MSVPGFPFFTTATTSACERPCQKVASRKFRGRGVSAAAAGPSPFPVSPWHGAQRSPYTRFPSSFSSARAGPVAVNSMRAAQATATRRSTGTARP